MTVHGRVQGVGFRVHAQARAHSLGVAGWIRNLPDGSVEAVLQGDPEHIEEWIEWAHNGPSLAGIERVDTGRVDLDPGLVDFQVR